MNDGLIAEDDFSMIKELGFNFVRIPFSYLFFGSGEYGRTPDPERLVLLDRAVEYGQKYGVHVMLALHRAPGYCVNAHSRFDFPEKGDLFTDDEEHRDFVAWWRTIAERYADVPAHALSFDLLNEPFNVDDATFERVFTPAIDAIEAANPERLIHVEGSYMIDFEAMTAELRPAPSSISQRPNVVNSVHLYHPFTLTHHECPWADELVPSDLEDPTWPYQAALKSDAGRRVLSDSESERWDKETIRTLLQQYLDLSTAGYKVHIGEMGAYSALAHDVYLDYMRDVISLLDEYDIGYALWNFRGPFGVVDTGREGPQNEDLHGHLLDRPLVDVLRGQGASLSGR